MYEVLFCSITSSKFRQTDELSKVGSKNPKSLLNWLFKKEEQKCLKMFQGSI